MLLQLWAGRFIIQPTYSFILNLKDERLEKSGDISAEEQGDILLGWAVGSTSDSNTITLVKNGMVIGNAVGQQDRVGACELALSRARRGGHDTNGAVAYSDSFFPFPDGPKVLVDAGIKVIFATSGSKNDKVVREFCQSRGVALWTIPDAVGRGFFGH
jgi:phosphoribosylaminoimidazolecarboxamide formyltransferase/IMP cyclohydrolase